MLEVFNFRTHDLAKKTRFIFWAKASVSRISELDGDLIEGTGELVQLDQIDERGFFCGPYNS
jgi:hypothetical protein